MYTAITDIATIPMFFDIDITSKFRSVEIMLRMIEIIANIMTVRIVLRNEAKRIAFWTPHAAVLLCSLLIRLDRFACGFSLNDKKWRNERMSWKLNMISMPSVRMSRMKTAHAVITKPVIVIVNGIGSQNWIYLVMVNAVKSLISFSSDLIWRRR